MSNNNEDAKKDFVALWDVRQCATFLGKSPRWLWSALKNTPQDTGSVPHVRIGATPRFIPADIEQWVRQGCPPAATFAQWNRTEEKRQKRALTP